MPKQPTLSDLLRETHVAPALLDRLARTAFNMGVRYPSVVSTTSLGAPPASGAETVVVTSPPLNIPLDFAQVLLIWFIDVLIGAGTTGATQRVRRGTTAAGAFVMQGSTLTATAASTVNFNGCWVDTPGAVAGQQYSVTLLGIGTTGAWTQGNSCLMAFAL